MKKYKIGQYVYLKFSYRGLQKGECVKIIELVKRGRQSYFAVQSESGVVYRIPSKYIKYKVSIDGVIILLPIPDTSKPKK